MKTPTILFALACFFVLGSFVMPRSAFAVQILLPTSDQATGSWSTTPGFSKIDDDSTVQSTGDGTTFQSEAVGNNTNTSNYDFKLGSGGNPGVTSGHTLRVRWNHNQGGRTMQGNFELWQGIPGSGTLIATLQVTPDVTTTENEATYTLTGGEAGAITDYADLYGRLWGRGTSGGPGRNLIIELAELEIPDAAAGSAPTVVTGYAANVGVTTALLNGAITSDGGQSITTYGFATSTSATLSTGVSTSSFGSITAPVAVATTSKAHSADTTYYFRFYATNVVGTSYGAIHSFTTGNDAVTRRLRLFGGFLIKFFSGTIVLNQR